MRIAIFEGYFLCLLALLCSTPALAQWDNLRVLGAAPTLTDDTGATMDMAALVTKYDERIVGMAFVKNNVEVRFYMNLTTWDKLKQSLILARDQWDTLKPTQFEQVASVKGYRIANKLGTLRVSFQGETALAARRMIMAASGGADKPKRALVALKEENLKTVVDSLFKIDEYLRAR